jgi:hypothetical protein
LNSFYPIPSVSSFYFQKKIPIEIAFLAYLYIIVF